MSISSRKNKIVLLALGALGVVYGDIGTSPLYAINEMFFGHTHLSRNIIDVFGAISLVFWALTLIISFKYVIFVLRADYDGEGGVFALVSLLKTKQLRKLFIVVIPLLIFAAGLLYGDGIITPAISVLSAVEGLSILTPTFQPLVIPITIAILTLLFYVQKKGTQKIGALFGPIVFVWFISIACIGLSYILKYPKILMAVNPLHAVNFMMHHELHKILLTLGSIMLVVTGGEAMYADMGHFGVKPIRLSWFVLTYPALLLNYFGQGAFLLSSQPIHNSNIFFSMVPSFALLPMIVLATMATIIASQALISGAFSLTTQAVALNLLPYLHTVNTHKDHEGQRYIPLVNWALYAGCIILVLLFKSSTNLASAYGLAVSGVMFMTSLAMIGVARYHWKWSKIASLGLFIPLLFIDGIFLSANSLKLFSGGYVPLLVALFLTFIMLTWYWGRRQVKRVYKSHSTMRVKELISLKQKNSAIIPKSIVFLSPSRIDSLDDPIPMLKQLFWERYNAIPQNLLFVHIKTEKSPYIHEKRFMIKKFFDDKKLGSIYGVTIRFGFMEEKNVEELLHGLALHKEINISDHPSEWLVHAMYERVIVKDSAPYLKKILSHIYNFLLNNSRTADTQYGLGNKINLSIEVCPVVIG